MGVPEYREALTSIAGSNSARAISALSARDRLVLVGGGCAVFLVIICVICRPWDLENAFMIGAPVGRDMANFWTGGRLALDGNLGLLIDLPSYNALLYATFHHNPEEWLVFSYPPHLLPFLIPFGAMPYLVAVIAWTAINLLLVVQAAKLLSNERALLWASCLSPAALMMVAHGHFGGALAFLATYALVRGRDQPIPAGICLALMTVKPQLAASLGFFMLLTGYWRAVLVSVPATACLVAVSIAAFGVQPWRNFIEWTVPFHAQMMSEFVVEALRTTMSVYMAARMGGLPASVAQALQYAFSLMALGTAVFVVRRTGPTPRSIALALLAVLAALPYSQNYDFVVAAPALTVALFTPEPGDERPFLPLVPAALLWVAPVFAIPFGLMALPIVPAVVSLVLLSLFVDRLRFALRGPRPALVSEC
jgi:alpha-1,2-mannosyltransferase